MKEGTCEVRCMYCQIIHGKEVKLVKKKQLHILFSLWFVWEGGGVDGKFMVAILLIDLILSQILPPVFI